MDAEAIVRIVSYTTVSLVLLVGIVVLTGVLIPAGISESFRVTLGSCMVLYGLYRFAVILIKQRNARNASEK